MIEQITLFIFILSLVFSLKFLIEFIFTVLQDTPTPMEIKPKEKIFLYFTIAYVLTYIINLII